MPAFKWSDLKKEAVDPEHSSATGSVFRGQTIEVRRVLYPVATEGKPHSHPNEQIQVVLKGKVRGFISGDEQIIEPGGGLLFPANVEHGIQILEDYTVINCKDIVPGWSVYHARWEK